MASLNQIAYDLLTIVRPKLSDDSNLDLRQIKFWIHNQRSLLIRNELNKNRTIDSDIVQTICSEMEIVDASDCCGIELDCDVLRSTKQLPETIELHNSQTILRVGPVNKKERPFSLVEYERVPWLGSGRFNNRNIFAFIHDRYVYVFSKNPRHKMLEAVSVRGVFEDPTEASNFSDCTSENKPCYTDDSKYPIKSWMIPYLKEAILKSNLLIQSDAEMRTADDSNNAKSDTVAKK